jgi:anti-anti-sigma regulatory factor
MTAGTLDLSIRRGDRVVELGLSGDLDLATASRLREAIAWLRFSRERDQTIVIDTRHLDFVAVAGYRALRAALVAPDGSPDPSVVCIDGPVVARLESAITASRTSGTSRTPRASRASARRSPSHHWRRMTPATSSVKSSPVPQNSPAEVRWSDSRG